MVFELKYIRANESSEIITQNITAGERLAQEKKNDINHVLILKFNQNEQKIYINIMRKYNSIYNMNHCYLRR